MCLEQCLAQTFFSRKWVIIIWEGKGFIVKSLAFIFILSFPNSASLDKLLNFSEP